MNERAWRALADACGWLAAQLDEMVERLDSAELRCLHRAWRIHDRPNLSARPIPPHHFHHVHVSGAPVDGVTVEQALRRDERQP